MTTQPTLPSYSEMTRILDAIETPFLAAQVHGYICGLICGSQGRIDNTWIKKVLENKKNRAAQESLHEVFEISFHQMSEFSFEFSLLLPDDKMEINLRTEALGSWCQGFLSGLKQCGISIEDRPPSEVTEALEDMVEIAKVNFDELSSNDEDETAYFELVEYVRLATLMIFHELNRPDPTTNIPTTQELH